MPHADWCGKECGGCESPCSLDESMPCSPDCKLVGEDGEPMDIEECLAAGCDAMEEE